MGKTIVKTLLLMLFSISSANAAGNLEEVKQQILSELYVIEGWCSPEKALNLFDLVIAERPEVCVEIGVFAGASMFPVASALKYLGEGVAIGIDPWDKLECIKHLDPIEEESHLDWWGKLNLHGIYSSYLKLIKKNGFEKICVTIKKTSAKAAADIGTIDILHIDGNHSEVISIQDVLLYLPKVRPGGHIWVNDCLSANLQQAIDLLLDACDVIKVIDSGNCILLKKR